MQLYRVYLKGLAKLWGCDLSKNKIGTSIKHGSGNAPILSYSPLKFQAKQTTMHTGNANG